MPSFVFLARAEAEKEMEGQVPVADLDSGVGFELAMRVSDVDARAAELAEREVQLAFGPVDRPRGVRPNRLPRSGRPSLGARRGYPCWLSSRAGPPSSRAAAPNEPAIHSAIVWHRLGTEIASNGYADERT